MVGEDPIINFIHLQDVNVIPSYSLKHWSLYDALRPLKARCRDANIVSGDIAETREEVHIAVLLVRPNSRLSGELHI